MSNILIKIENFKNIRKNKLEQEENDDLNLRSAIVSINNSLDYIDRIKTMDINVLKNSMIAIKNKLLLYIDD